MGFFAKTKAASPTLPPQSSTRHFGVNRSPNNGSQGLPRSSKERSAKDRMEQIERLTHLLDESFKLPGTDFRIGWDALIGLIPGAGDIASSALSAFMIYQAHRMGASKWIVARMMGNVGLDFLIGVVPVLGDTFDVFFKSNRRNTRLLKKHFESR